MRSLALVPALASLLLAACGDNNGDAPDGGGGNGDGPPPIDAPPDAGEPPGDPTTGAWVDSFSLPGPSGFGSRVEAVAIMNNDFYAAGIFEDAAGVPVRNVARWDGTDWEPLGDGLDGWVRALELADNGFLWAAITSDDASAGTVASWDGIEWTHAPPLDGQVRDMAVTQFGIAAVGDFTGGVRVLDPATNSWSDITPNGVSGAPSAVARAPTGFCVAGSFDSINGVAAENAACWNGTSWRRLGRGLPGGVAVLKRSPSGQWFAGGTLTFIVDQTTGEYEAGIGHLVSGVWRPFEGGIDNGFINEVRAIAFQGTDVLVGGHFQTAGRNDVPASHLARFTPGTGWSEESDGLANDVGVFLPYIIGANDIQIWSADGSLVVGGLFTRAGGVPAVNIARTNPLFEPMALVGPHTVLGVGGFLDTVARAEDGGVLAGGAIAFGGETPISALGALKDEAWMDLGGLGLRGIVRDVLALPGGRIAAAGELEVGGSAVAYAEWDGAAWTVPGGPVEGAGFALARDASGAVWLGGLLFTANGAPISHVARLANGAWTAEGMFDERVTSLAFDGDRLAAAGIFTMVDGTPAAAIAIRDSAGTWSELGGGLDGDFAYANAIAVSPALGIIVGGSFEGAGGVAAVNLAAWDGTTWRGLDTGFSTDDFGFVSAILPYGNGVFISGGFGTLGGAPAANLGWYDGTAWHALGFGLADLAEEMVVIDRVLWIGGPFTAAGGRPASGIAAWDFR